MKHHFPARTLLALAAVAIAAIFAASGLASTSPTSAATTINVNVGGGQAGIAADGFFPATVTITTGTTIHFVNPYEELHTATFFPAGQTPADLIVKDPGGSPAQGFNPVYANQSPTSPATFDSTKVVNSGIMAKGSTYDVTFSGAGSFVFHCAFHPMTLTINVVSSGTVDTQATVDARAATELAATLAAGKTAQDAATAAPVTKTTMADGSTNWTVVTGGGAPVPNSTDLADLMQFFPPTLTIKQGDTVTWTNNSGGPHTVSFLSGAALPAIITPIPEASGPPFQAFNIQVALAMGGNTYNGTGFVSSGLFGEGFPNPPAFSVKFTAAGTFNYVCILHADQGMAGAVTVEPAAAAAPTVAPAAPPTGVVAPNTGSGPDAGGSGSAWIIAMIAAAFGGSVLLFAGALSFAKVRER